VFGIDDGDVEFEQSPANYALARVSAILVGSKSTSKSPSRLDLIIEPGFSGVFVPAIVGAIVRVSLLMVTSPRRYPVCVPVTVMSAR
jgi:hypothetical protein